MYSAIVATITVRPHPNADRLLLGTVVGHQVIVGADTKTGDIGIFFPPDGQLSEEYAKANKLMKEDGGYLDSKRRVKALRLRGEKSEGLFMPLSSLYYISGAGGFTTEIGTMFTEFMGKPICNKYETPKTKQQAQGKGRTHQKQNMYFKKHYDTPQWRFFKDQIPDNAFISITEKVHGTSGRYGLVLCDSPRRWWHRLLGSSPKPHYQYLLGTRNVILDSAKLADGTSYYGNESFRFDAVRGLQLYQGEILYFELVGSFATEHGIKDIMPAQPIKDKELEKQYGKEMRYTYGQEEGTTGLYVYRITRTSPEGVVTELSWNQVKQRCNELGLSYVPELERFVKVESYPLESRVETLTEGSSTLDSRHIREGVVVRVESENGTNWYKNKSFTFGVLEGYIKDDDGYIDTEEAS
jgi:hypothetical protein